MVTSEPMEEFGQPTTRGIESAVPTESACLQGLSAEGEPGAVVGLPLRKGHVQLSAEMDGSTEVAAVDAVRQARRHVAEPSGWHSELLPHEGSLRSGRSGQRECSFTYQPRSWLQEPAIPAAEGQAAGRDQPRIRRSSEIHESRVEWPLLRIPAESRKMLPLRIVLPIQQHQSESCAVESEVVINLTLGLLVPGPDEIGLNLDDVPGATRVVIQIGQLLD